MAFKVNPVLEILAQAGVGNRSDVVFLRGFVAQTGKTSVAIKAGLFGASTYEVAVGDIITSKDNSDGSVTLMVRDSATVVIQTTAGVLQEAREKLPTKGEIDKCIQDSRNNCINNLVLGGSTPQHAAAACDNSAVASIRESLCSNPLRLGGLAASALGSEVVGDMWDFT
jgi:hypothetical protein